MPGSGHTVRQEVVLSLGVAAFIAAFVCFFVIYRRRSSLFALLTAVSFAMFAASLGVVVLTDAFPGSEISWAARAGTWIGGIYLLAGAMSAEYGGAWLLPLERSLRETEERYESLVETSPDAVWIRSDGRFVFANAAAAQLFGFASAAEMVGKDVDEMFHPETRDAQRERVAQVYAGGISFASDEMFLRADGSAVHATVFRTRVEYGGRLAIQAVARDITEQERVASV
jgi:PAS domain S-box-containing protein